MKKRMLKIELLLPQSALESSLEALRETALLHLENFEPERQSPSADLEQLEKVLQLLPAHAKAAASADDALSTSELIGEIQDNQKGREKLAQEAERCTKELAHYERWGEIAAHQREALAQRGLHLALCESPLRNFQAYTFDESLSVLPVAQANGRIYFAVFGAEEALASLSFERQEIPALTRTELSAKLEQIKSQQAALNERLLILAAQRPRLEKQCLAAREADQFRHARQIFHHSENHSQCYWRAWLPAEKLGELKSSLDSLALAYRIVEPQKGDPVPIALEHGAYSGLFAPIMRIFQLPHYFEFDLTPLIAVFYPILFAYCLGDAGYGAILVLLSAYFYWAGAKAQRRLAILGLILGFATALMGLIKSGSLFGLPLSLDSDQPLLAFLAQAVVIPDDSDYFFNAFNVALLIGVFQILVALVVALVKTWRFEGFKASLSHWGKLFIVISAVALFMKDSLGLGLQGQKALYASLAGGVLLVMFFHDLGLSLVPRLGSSILPLFFIFTGLLGDVLSYVRLFALGVTSAVLGLVVNRIAMDMLGEWYSWLWVGAFLVFGHSLNLALAGLGSFIHPLRLTFVEFYNNAQFEGGGKEYRAFKKINSL